MHAKSTCENSQPRGLEVGTPVRNCTEITSLPFTPDNVKTKEDLVTGSLLHKRLIAFSFFSGLSLFSKVHRCALDAVWGFL